MVPWRKPMHVLARRAYGERPDCIVEYRKSWRNVEPVGSAAVPEAVAHFQICEASASGNLVLILYFLKTSLSTRFSFSDTRKLSFTQVDISRSSRIPRGWRRITGAAPTGGSPRPRTAFTTGSWEKCTPSRGGRQILS
jgi:hypothetical protein